MSSFSEPTDTPLMQQWRAVKARHPDSLILFRVGDFYEMFFEDAEEGAKLLNITLTSRNNGSSKAPLAGIPFHARDSYVRRLIRMGKRVAICEQVEDPGAGKAIFKREVTETISPGTALSDTLLVARRNNWLAAVAGDLEPGGKVAVAAADLSTGEITVSLLPTHNLGDWLGQLEPSELLLPRSWQLAEALPSFSVAMTWRPDWIFEAASGRETLLRHYGVTHLDGFGLPDDPSVIGATGALVSFLVDTQPTVSAVLRPPRYLVRSERMPIDEMTRRNLEIVEPLVSGDGGRTLLNVLDEALTPMGGRLLRKWLLAPLLDRHEVQARQDAVGAFFDDAELRREVRRALKEVRDLERLAVKVASGRCAPRDLLTVRSSLRSIPEIREALDGVGVARLLEHREGLDPLEGLATLIATAISDEPPATLGEGGVIRDGFNAQLDGLRGIRDGAVDFIARLQAKERERTGIGSLKVGFNKVFGYFIEVTKANVDRVPSSYQRRQTLTNGERYITPELKEWEEKVLGAEDQIAALEANLFDRVRRDAAEYTSALQRLAEHVAAVDVLAALAEVAVRNEYVRPTVDDGARIEIRGGRHPVVETMMPREEFIPNDVMLGDEARVIILTGPNMAGKSTILRQVGLIVLLAQVGAYVPARAARIGMVDRIFTRVGASDNLVRGRSTFMVEMTETAAILNNATAASLVLLDEIGRGTSTWDGLSVATAVTEHLHDSIGAKTVFATHYHELTKLADELDSLANFSVAVKEEGESIVFLRSLVKGGADRSYGVEVARLAGLPPGVVHRARDLLQKLERGERSAAGGGTPRAPQEVSVQLGLFTMEEHPAITRLQRVDVNTLTPVQALALLADLAREARD
jgi:DNA mismatch repair protein MutS